MTLECFQEPFWASAPRYGFSRRVACCWYITRTARYRRRSLSSESKMSGYRSQIYGYKNILKMIGDLVLNTSAFILVIASGCLEGVLCRTKCLLPSSLRLFWTTWVTNDLLALNIEGVNWPWYASVSRGCSRGVDIPWVERPQTVVARDETWVSM